MRTTTLALAIILAASVSGCSPHKAPDSAAVPPKIMDDTFKGCAWEKVTGQTLSIWSYACPAAQGGIHLIANNALPGFEIESIADKSRSLAIQTFAKEAADPIDAALPAIRKASPGPHTDSCVLTAVAPVDFLPGKLYTLQPTGAVKTAWDRAESGGADDVPPPCGDLGVSYAGDHFFEVLPDDPKTVVMLNMGSEIQIFDPKTLKTN